MNGTVKRLEATVRTTRITSETRPFHPRNGSLREEMIPVIKIAALATQTPVKSSRLFQLSFGILFFELSVETWECFGKEVRPSDTDETRRW